MSEETADYIITLNDVRQVSQYSRGDLMAHYRESFN